MKLFISYSRDDKLYVYELVDRLRDDGNHTVWIDKASLVGGESWWDAILNGIANCECVVVIISPRALGSIYCNAELRYAQALNKPILPLMLKTADIPAHLSAIQAENVSEMSLERAYGRCERALGQIELRRERGQYPEPKPTPARPTVPVLQSGQESEHVFEVYANAVEALEKDPTLAKKLLQQVITADPTGLGVQAAERLAEIEYEMDRKKAYLAIARLVGNPGMHRDAVRAWKAFAGKYTAAYDPNGYARTLNDEPAVPPPQPIEARLTAPVAPPAPAKPRYTPDQQRLLDVMLDIKRPPAERAKAGQDINQYGDPRPGVIDFNFKVGDYWCPVPAGTYPLGSDEDSDNPKHSAKLSAFYIAKYPITYAQFQAFIDAKDGFGNTAWWKDLHADGLAQQKEGTGDQRFKIANHPREQVSWYEAIAFSRWLSAKLGYSIRLPTDDEWEAAARGMDQRVYPYVGDYDSAKGNTSETGIGQTSAVGIFLNGASPYGVLDMSGNVWEWLVTEYKNRNSHVLSNSAARSVRGGSWHNHANGARAAIRDYYVPADQDDDFGFRVVCAYPF